MSKDRRLGRGLAALLGSPLDEAAEGGTIGNPATTGISVPSEPAPPKPSTSVGEFDQPESAKDPELLHLNVYEIDDNPFQPRRDFSEPEIVSLSESLKEHDMLQPILVRKVGDRYQLISGERRLRAAIQAGWSTVPARVRDAEDRLVAELAIVENLQRKDLNPVEKAMSFKRYLDQHGCAQEDLARRLKIDRSTIANLMRLLELPEPVLQALQESRITAGHARALLPLGEESQQIEFSARIQAEGLSVRAVENLVQEQIAEEDGETLSIAGKTSRARRTQSDQVSSLEQELRMTLGTKVEIKQTAKGRGRIVVHFKNHSEFERLRDQLNGEHHHAAAREAS